MDWLPIAERIITGKSGGIYLGGPFRIVLHRTEGSSIEGALSVYRKVDVAPHLTVDLRKRRVVQHTKFSLASRALQNLPGGVETNRRSTIQIEIVGFSKNAAKDRDEDLQWFGIEVLGPIMRAYKIKPLAPTFYGEGAGWILASAKAKQRMSAAEWNAFNGVCSHQHVPEQSHWDCGEFKIKVALDAAFTQEDDELTPEEKKQLDRVEAMCWNIGRQLGFDFDGKTGEFKRVGFGTMISDPVGKERTVVEALDGITTKLSA